jgi:hypothetical protein
MNPATTPKGRQVKNPSNSLRTLSLALTTALLAGALFLTAASASAAAPTHPFDQSLSHEGAFNKPCGTATDSEGDLYVAGNEEDKVKVYSSAGALISQFTPAAIATAPCFLAVDSNGDPHRSAPRVAALGSGLQAPPSIRGHR